ncbi:ABC transporter ATP-binding protein [Wielerella bovis]|uniref:ABC transporter ATP-binding protein n=1 Tax=Wielerella bovis TaxID=2917790 RepID=UPI002018B390|nr:ABC transporter ATP-binding protein [Wielerella bovis]ULJ62317.1 ABC transporter ATP-binding protein [Wielerella bovis]
MFQLKQVQFAVPERVLLHNINLTFHTQKVYGLIGHNGSGKSTLLKLLVRQHRATAGEILLDGKCVDDYSPREYAQHLAYLPQHLPAAAALTAEELVKMGRYAWTGLTGRENEADRAAVQRALALTRTEKFRHEFVDNLSGGERSRVWLAMCLAQESRYLLLDEPLAALDIAHQLDVMTLVRELSRELDLGVIVVIHDINLAARFCDELVALHQGQVLKVGQPENIMTADVLRDIYSVEMQILHHPITGNVMAVP